MNETKLCHDDRFIPKRCLVNANSYYLSSISSNGTLIQTSNLKAMCRARNRQRALEKVLNIRDGVLFRSDKFKWKSVEYWECRPRQRAQISTSKLMSCNDRSPGSPMDFVIDVSSEGEFYAVINGKEIINISLGNPVTLEDIFKSAIACFSILRVHPRYPVIAIGLIQPVYPHRVYCLDLKLGKEFITMDCCDNSCVILAMDWHTQRNYLYTGCSNGVVAMHNMDGSKKLYNSTAHSKGVIFAKVSPSGAFLVTATKTGKICIWNPFQLSLLKRIAVGPVRNTISWHPWACGVLAVGEVNGSGKIHIYRCTEDKITSSVIICTKPCFITALTFHPYTGELVYAQCHVEEENDLDRRNGEATTGCHSLVVLNGEGSVVDYTDACPVLTTLLWTTNGSQLVGGGPSNVMAVYNFCKPHKESLKDVCNIRRAAAKEMADILQQPPKKRRKFKI